MSHNAKVSRADVATANDITVARIRRTPIDASTFHCWTLDELTGLVYADSGSDGTPLTGSGAVVAGCGALFDNGVAITGNTGRLAQTGQGTDPAAALTVSLWVRFNAAPGTAWTHLMRKEDSYHAWAGLLAVMGWNTDAGGNLVFGAYYDATHSIAGVSIPVNRLTLYQWHHLAVTIVAGAPGLVTVYMNGRAVGTCPYPAAAIYWGTQPAGATRGQWWLGTDPAGSMAIFGVTYDDIRCESVARTAAYFQALYENGRS